MRQFPEVKLPDNSVFQGQWKEEGVREGLGLLIWPDGSKFLGYWKGDQADGFGVLNHSDGDVFIGRGF